MLMTASNCSQRSTRHLPPLLPREAFSRVDAPKVELKHSSARGSHSSSLIARADETEQTRQMSKFVSSSACLREGA